MRQRIIAEVPVRKTWKYARIGRSQGSRASPALNLAIREQSTAGRAFSARYQRTDALGSPAAVRDQARALIETSEYEPYGKEVSYAFYKCPVVPEVVPI